jgi:CRISPR/Cas system endoribonuclease Cas6 (RAMP superfamily)
MIKLTFELYPKDGRIKPYEHPYGYIFRGVIMKWLHEIKPELVHQLHAYEKVRPYSINCIIYKKIPKIHFIIVSMDDTLSETLLQDLISSERVELKFGQKIYYIASIQFERINIKEKFINRSRPVKRFNINFVRPVYFNTSMGNYPVRFPLPNLLFGNLANIWNDIAIKEGELDRDIFINWLNAHVYASGYRMKTVRATIGKPVPVIGGIGNASYGVTAINRNYYKHYLEQIDRQYDYEFLNEDFENKCRWLEILCYLGEYTNVGANRTAGMGVMRYYPKRYLSSNDFLSKDAK